MTTMTEGETHDIFNQACFHGNIPRMESIYQQFQIDINKNGGSIMAVCHGDHLEALKWLIERGVDYSYNNGLPFAITCCRGRFDLMKYLYSINGFCSNRMMEYILDACENGHLEIMQFLVSRHSYNADEICEMILRCCHMKQSLRLVKHLYKKLDECHPIYPDNISRKMEQAVRLCLVLQNKTVGSWLIDHTNYIEHQEKETFIVLNGTMRNKVDFLTDGEDVRQLQHLYFSSRVHLASIRNGYIDLIKYFCEAEYEDNIILGIGTNEFEYACLCEQIECVKYIQTIVHINNLRKCVRQNDNKLFIRCCQNGNIAIVKILKSICPELKYVIARDGVIVPRCYSRAILEQLLEENKFQICAYKMDIQVQPHCMLIPYIEQENSDKTCPVCYYNEVDTKTNCGHHFCLKCFVEWHLTQANNDKICPYCRQQIILNQCTYYTGEDDILCPNSNFELVRTAMKNILPTKFHIFLKQLKKMKGHPLDLTFIDFETKDIADSMEPLVNLITSNVKNVYVSHRCGDKVFVIRCGRRRSGVRHRSGHEKSAVAA